MFSRMSLLTIGLGRVMQRYDIYWVKLDPTIGCEINKIRPCVITSPDELNRHLQTVVVAPLTSTVRGNYPFRLNISVGGKNGQVALDQLRTVDKSRLIKKMGTINDSDAQQLRDILHNMFCIK